jgi:O-antigen chain-terminating methyltransferase
MGSQRDYYEFMGYKSEELLERYQPYADRFQPQTRVLDVGCGRGEFLELLHKRGVQGVGLDADEGMIECVRSKGLQAEQGGGVAFMKGHPGDFDGVFAAHVIEHYEGSAVAELVRAAAIALRPGGRLLLVSPNPHNLQMHLRDFWVDPDHVRFYNADAMRWLLHDAGFHSLEDGANELYLTAEPAVDLSVAPKFGPAYRREQRSLPRLSLLGRLHQRLNDWLTPASTLQRIQELEEHAQRLGAEVEEVRDHLRHHFSLMQALEAWPRSLYPGGEFWVSGVR